MSGREAIKNSGETVMSGDLNQWIAAAVAAIPEQEPPFDPYARPPMGTAVEMPGITRSKDGHIKFGPDYDIRRIMIGRIYEVILAAHKPGVRNEFIVNQFAPEGGLKSRMSFTDNGQQGVCKEWEADSYGGLIDINSREFRRPLSEEESAVINNLIKAIAAGLPVEPVLEELVTVSDEEQAMIDAFVARRDEMVRKLEEDLEKIAEAERRAAQEARNIIIY